MHVVISNLGTADVPYSSSQGKGFAALIASGMSITLNSADVTVLNVGENPSALEEFAEGMGHVLERLVDLITFWKPRAAPSEDASKPTVHVAVENHGQNALRLLLGVNTAEMTVNPGGTYEAVSPGYVEIREMGV